MHNAYLQQMRAFVSGIRDTCGWAWVLPLARLPEELAGLHVISGRDQKTPTCPTLFQASMDGSAQKLVPCLRVIFLAAHPIHLGT